MVVEWIISERSEQNEWMDSDGDVGYTLRVRKTKNNTLVTYALLY